MVALDVKRILEQLGIDFKRYEEWLAKSPSRDGGGQAGADESRRPSQCRVVRAGRMADGLRHLSRIRPAGEEPMGAAGIR
jgi:hypothetical protein